MFKPRPDFHLEINKVEIMRDDCNLKFSPVFFYQPPKKKKSGKKKKGKKSGKAKTPTVIDGISTEEMSKEQVSTFINMIWHDCCNLVPILFESGDGYVGCEAWWWVCAKF